MNQIQRLYLIDDLLQYNVCVDMARLEKELEVHVSTIKRDLEYMRSRLFAPIVYDDDRKGYHLDKLNPDYQKYRLPGLWFNAREIHAILTLQHYFADVSPHLLGKQVTPLSTKLRELLKGTNYNQKEIADKIKIIHLGRRESKDAVFEKVADALMTSKRIKIRYHNRGKDEYRDREVSPLRLVHYRENWYLDGWCHVEKALRIFSVDAIEEAWLTTKRAKKVDKVAHDKHVTAGYGMFSGEMVQWAKLRFSAKRSRWVAQEQWHPNQRRELDDEDRIILEVPYSDDRELIMDIMKYGPDVQVLEPDSLRERVKTDLMRAASLYS